MAQTKSGHLIDILAEIPDPRNAKGKRHLWLCLLMARRFGGVPSNKRQ